MIICYWLDFIEGLWEYITNLYLDLMSKMKANRFFISSTGLEWGSSEVDNDRR
jgi:hypothetical protein